MAKGAFPFGKMSAKKDDKLDKKAGIKENSAKDKKLDAKRGIKDDMPKKGGFTPGKKGVNPFAAMKKGK